MIIDKSIGIWNDNLDYIDDIAYYLFIKQIVYSGLEKSPDITSQSVLYSLYHMKTSNLPISSIDRVRSFYDDAKLILRREKILKILSRDNR